MFNTPTATSLCAEIVGILRPQDRVPDWPERSQGRAWFTPLALQRRQLAKNGPQLDTKLITIHKTTAVQVLEETEERMVIHHCRCRFTDQALLNPVALARGRTGQEMKKHAIEGGLSTNSLIGVFPVMTFPLLLATFVVQNSFAAIA